MVGNTGRQEKWIRVASAWRLAWLVVLVAALGACTAPLLTVERPPPNYAYEPRDSSVFGPIAETLSERYGQDVSGFMLIEENRAALEWRLRLIDSASYSIDLQYYLWYGDTAGRLLAHRVLAAADRGVRVRILIDDLNTLLRDANRVQQRDAVVALVDAHPNVELRLFNPWSQRDIEARFGESLSEFDRVNRRMHNKALIVDNLAVIIGGRNLGDEYMGLSPKFNFRDHDVLAVGPVAAEASTVFDRFWNSDWVVSAGALGVDAPDGRHSEYLPGLQARLTGDAALASIGIAPREWTQELNSLARELHPGQARVVSDLPSGREIQRNMLRETRKLIRSSREAVMLANAYIIPTSDTITLLQGLNQRGVALTILTNSLASHDVPAVNSHYKRWRRPLIDAGVRLFELRHDGSTQTGLADTPPTRSDFMGLHSKVMTVDSRWVYVGSMNYDPRSAALNTEMGLFIDSPGLAQVLKSGIERDIQPSNSWQVSVDDAGDLRWHSDEGTVYRQPARSWWQRVEDQFFMLFPKDLY